MRESNSEIRSLSPSNRVPAVLETGGGSGTFIDKTANDAIKSYRRNWLVALGAQGVVKAYKFDLETEVS